MQQGTAEGGLGDSRQFSPAYRYYIVGVLLLVGTLNFLDRHVMSVLLEPIRRDLQLSDTQMGFLTGIAFGLTYVLLSIPAALLADRWSRRNVIAIAIFIWSAGTIFCGLAKNAFQLFIGRVAVGFGEAGGSPPSQAIISDLFSRERRATAMAFFTLCSPFGLMLGLMGGGWALQEYGWRTTFILAGLPGLLIIPLVLLTVPDPPKGMSDGLKTPPANVPFLETVRILWSIRTFRYLGLAATLQTVLTIGLSTWIPAFLMRSHQFDPASLGLQLGITVPLGLVAGILLGGPLIDWLGRRDLRMQLWFGAVSVLVAASFGAAAFLADREYVFILLGLQAMFGSMFSGPLPAIALTLAPVAVRATAYACLLVFINAFAFGLAPQIVGWASDLLRPAYGEESLRVALLSATALALPTAIFFLLGSRSYRADLDEALARDAAASGT